VRFGRFALVASLLFTLPFAAGDSAAMGVDDPPGDDGGGGDPFRARLDLARAAGASDPDVTGWVELRSGDGRERFQVEVDHLAVGATVEVLVADGVGTLVSAGFATAGAMGDAELELDTGDGAALPAGAATAAELVGRAVEVRDAEDGLLLSGAAPAIDGSAATRSGRHRGTDDDSGVSVRVLMKFQGRLGRQEFRIDVRGLEDDAGVELWIDDGTGTLVMAESTTASHRGRSRMRHRSRMGDPMPLSVPEVGDLSGRAFELRSGGGTVYSGVLPTLG
jgi:hypothetical protein